MQSSEHATESESLARVCGPSKDIPLWLAVPLLAVLCLVLFFYGMASGDLYRTETLRAAVAAEMLRDGNWLVPRLYGQPFLTKPPLMYAAIALCSWPRGRVTEWSARLPSALAASSTVFLIFWYFGRALGRRAGLIAAVIAPVSFLWLERAPSAEIDMLQVAWVTAAVLFFLRALEDCESPSETAPKFCGLRWWLFAVLSMAGGFLTKWTAPAFFYATVIPLLCWRRQLHLLWSGAHVVSVILAAALCFGWTWVVVRSSGLNVLFETVRNEALGHLSPVHHRDGQSWSNLWMHPLRIMLASLPWSACLLMACRPTFARLWTDNGLRLFQGLHCWLWPSLVIWSLIPSNSLRHSFPLFPAVSGLAAMWLFAWQAKLATWQPIARPRVSWLLAGCLGLWIMTKFIHVHVIMAARTEERATREKGQNLAALVPTGQPLLLWRLKDDGLLFYYGGPARRVASEVELEHPGEVRYGLFTEAEWLELKTRPTLRLIAVLSDSQGDPVALVEAGTRSRGN